MENLKNRESKIGRPQYIPDLQLLKELYERIEKNEITNEERLANCWLWQDEMV